MLDTLKDTRGAWGMVFVLKEPMIHLEHLEHQIVFLTWKRKKTLDCLELSAGPWNTGGRCVPLSLETDKVNVRSYSRSVIQENQAVWNLERGLTFRWRSVHFSWRNSLGNNRGQNQNGICVCKAMRKSLHSASFLSIAWGTRSHINVC